jgi:hypothetical protein
MTGVKTSPRMQRHDAWSWTQAALRFAGTMLANIVAPAQSRWDDVTLNEYADFATFRAIVDTDAYRREAQPHQVAALEDFRLFVAAGE